MMLFTQLKNYRCYKPRSIKFDYHNVWSALIQRLLTEPFCIPFQERVITDLCSVLELELNLNKAYKEAGVLSNAIL